MFKIAIAGSLLVLASCHRDHPINEDIVKEIKQKTTAWIPHEVEENPLRHKTRDEISEMLGVQFPNEFLPYTPDDENMSYNAPLEFDARKQWPDCIHPIRDQQRCGSCWAFGASEAFSDRLCIETKGKVNKVLSPQYEVSCDKG